MPFFSWYIITFLVLPLKLLNDFSWHSYKLPFFQRHRRRSPKGSNRPLTLSCSLSYTHTLRIHEELSAVSGMFKVLNNFSTNLISLVLCFMFYILSLATYHGINTYISMYHDYFILLFLILLQITSYIHLSSGDSPRKSTLIQGTKKSYRMSTCHWNVFLWSHLNVEMSLLKLLQEISLTKSSHEAMKICTRSNWKAGWLPQDCGLGWKEEVRQTPC